MNAALACIDLGSTTIKAALFDDAGELVATAWRRAPEIEAWRGFDAFDPRACVEAAWDALAEAVGVLAGEACVRGLILTSQRATMVPVTKDGGSVGPAISWQDTSGEDLLAECIQRVGGERFRDITGLPPSVLWSLAKILRLRRDVPEVFRAARKIVLLHDYVLHGLGGERLVTDVSNASVTGLLDIRRRAWSEFLLGAIGLSPAMLPEIVPGGTVCGHLDPVRARGLGFSEPVPLMVGGGDQQCATLGVGARDQGDAGLCLGTAAILSCPLDRPAPEAAGEFFCTAHVLEDRWVLEGIHNTFGGSIEWAGRLLNLEGAAKREALVQQSAVGARGVQFLPFLAGIGSPDYDAACAGTFVGLRGTHTRADVLRAVYEGILLETRRILDAACRSSSIGRLFVSGGFAAGGVGQLLADVLHRRIHITTTPETSLLGAAVVGWYGLGRYPDMGAAAERMLRGKYAVLEPSVEDVYKDLFMTYRHAVAGIRKLYAQPEEGREAVWKASTTRG